jgi:uncharacterized membrane protein affecting hemolysin expression
MDNIYLMYAVWLVAGVVLLAYIAYRRKRKMFSQLPPQAKG